MIGTIDEMAPLMHESNATLVAALIGVFGALLGVVLTILFEGYRRKKEAVEKIKPIVINHDDSEVRQIDSNEFVFEAEEGFSIGKIIGSFKNTDNGILFIDYIKTETKTYLPKQHSTVDKDTLFRIILYNIDGETFKQCLIICHDVSHNYYQFKARFDLNMPELDRITLISSEPERIRIKEKR